MKLKSLVSLCLILIFIIMPVNGKTVDEKNIPSRLKPWKSWVLYGTDKLFCPSPFDDGNEYLCIWPARLGIRLTDTGGNFSQQFLVYSEQWISIPGNMNVWPHDLEVNGIKTPVVDRNGVPSIFLKKGSHLVKGVFRWKSMPEMITVPEKTGLVDLVINNKPVESLLLDNQGHLWLQNKKTGKTEEDRLEVKLFRLLDDDIPMFITSLARLYISGQAREIKLSDLLPEGFIPMEINSPLPVLIGENGDVVVQARPGRWDVYIKTRSKGPVNSIGPEKASYGQEIWAVESRTQLRMIKVLGVKGVDPGQTDLPAEWKSFSAYIINKGDTMVLEQTRRGDPSPAPDHLTLNRTIWLDFNGKGYTLKDDINGTMSQQWYLAMNPPVKLGRVVLDGVDQLITGHGKDNKPGVELRKGSISLEGESRIDSGVHTIPAVGWDHNVQQLSATLNLPPGWRLINVTGVDSIKGTWLQSWNLLDLFLVLVISTAIFRLYNIRCGILALFTLVLIYHEPGSPKIVWLNLLAATALLRFIPDGWFKKIVELWRLASIIVLIVMVVPFVVRQARTGMYPQLERVRDFSGYMYLQKTPVAPTAEAEMKTTSMSRLRQAPKKESDWAEDEFTLNEVTVSGSQVHKSGYYDKNRNVMLQDPNALIQTGPGLPRWQWHTYSMKWNGPVDSGQKLGLWLVSPFLNCILSFVRILLLVILVLCVTDLKTFRTRRLKTSVSVLFLFFILVPASDRAFAEDSGDFPPPQLLNELKNRLLEKDECFPYCADSPDMEVSVDNDNVRVIFRVHSAIETAVPVPGSSMMWNPEEIYLGNNPAGNLYRDQKGIMWVLVPEGIHDIVLRGRAPAANEFQVPLTLIPHNVLLRIKGWAAYGVDREGQVQGSIKFVRLEKKNNKETGESRSVLPPFFHIERIISLGIDWQIHTIVRRITPSGDPVVVSVPLVKGESVITGGIKVEDKRTVLSFSPGEIEKSWVSTIAPSNEILLRASETTEWTEAWILDASPIWHCELSGIPMIHHQDRTGQWQPEWRPWQGEEVKIAVTRPMAIPGKIITIDNARLTYTPGKRISMSDLTLNIRSSQGGQHKILLPEGANLRQVSIAGKSQPVSQQGRNVTIPLNPGAQKVVLGWQQETGSGIITKAPAVDIGTEAVNAYVTFRMPQNRWILFTGGPVLGPAVLFWSYLVVIILAGILLGRIKWTPLGTFSWILLGLGLTQVPPLTAVIIAGWFLAMGVRKRAVRDRNKWIFNLTQLVLAVWFILAMKGLWSSIERGLLGIPNMQIQGNGSSGFILNWMQDRTASMLPAPWVISLHIFIFKGLMLIWALWLAYSLVLKWLPWAWDCFSEGGIFKKIKIWKKRKKAKVKEEEVMELEDAE